MIGYTKAEVCMFFVCVIVCIVLYVYLYVKKNRHRKLGNYLDLIYHCWSYAIMAVFVVVGIDVVKLAIEQGNYVILIIPLGWFLLVYLLLSRYLRMDFGIDISIIRNSSIKTLLGSIWMPVLMAIVFIVLSIVFFYLAFTESELLIGFIALIFAGFAFLSFGMLMIYCTYFMVSDKSFNFDISFTMALKLIIIFVVAVLLLVGIKAMLDYKEDEKVNLDNTGYSECLDNNKSNSNKNYYM